MNDLRDIDILTRFKAGFTLDSSAKEYNISRERVRQIIMKALSNEYKRNCGKPGKIINRNEMMDIYFSERKRLKLHHSGRLSNNNA